MTWSSCVRQSAAEIDLPAVELLQEIVEIVGDDIDDVRVQRLTGAQTLGGAHGTLGPVGVSAAMLGETANVGDRVVDRLALHGRAGLGRLRLRRLGILSRGFRGLVGLGIRVSGLRGVVGFGRARRGRAAGRADGHGRCGAEIGGGRHRGNVARIENVGAGARGARALRRDVGNYRHAGIENRADDVAHGAVQAARRVHLDDDELGVAIPRLLDAPHEEVRRRGPDRTLHGQQRRQAPGLAGSLALGLLGLLGVQPQRAAEAERRSREGPSGAG
jgi:hypothetical protein